MNHHLHCQRHVYLLKYCWHFIDITGQCAVARVPYIFWWQAEVSNWADEVWLFATAVGQNLSVSSTSCEWKKWHSNFSKYLVISSPLKYTKPLNSCDYSNLRFRIIQTIDYWLILSEILIINYYQFNIWNVELLPQVINFCKFLESQF